MIYVGIDIAKLTHYAAIMNSDGEVLVEPFSFFKWSLRLSKTAWLPKGFLT